MGFNRKTVFVVGAGASAEVKFPTGAELLQRIAKSLDIRSQRFGDSPTGSAELLQALQRKLHAEGAREQIDAYVHAGWRLRDAAKIARSIDNAIDQNSGDARVEFAGKLAIALEILKAEQKSLIARDPFAQIIDPTTKVSSNHWLHHLAQMLTTDRHRSTADTIFDNISIVTFNYDRSIEHYLQFALTAAYGISEPEAQEAVGRLHIHHVYGSIGRLPWLGVGGVPVRYGAPVDEVPLSEVAAGIQTFTESRRQDANLALMHQRLEEADQVIFLGFGYHPLNMEVLRPPNGLQNVHLFGTVFNESEPAKAIADTRIRTLLRKDHSPQGISLSDARCANFMAAHFSVFTA